MGRARLAIALVLALAAAAVADAIFPARPSAPRPDRAGSPGGVWGCPFAWAGNGAGWLHLANAGRTPSSVRVTFVQDGSGPVDRRLGIAPGYATTIPVPRTVKRAAGAIVEFAGGDLVVARSAFFTAAPGVSGGVAASCSRAGPETLVVPQGSTFRAETHLVLLNPGTSDAVVDVSLLVDGLELEPEKLRRRIVRGRSRLVIRVGDFAFDARAVAVVVRSGSGRVVADAVLSSRGAVELIPAIGPGRELVALAGAGGGRGSFASVTFGDEDAIVDARVLSPGGQGAYEPLAGGLAPGTPRLIGLPAESAGVGAVALAVAARGGSPLAPGARWQVPSGTKGAVVFETAVSTGVPPAHRSLAVLGPPADPRGMRLLLANPGERRATVRVTLLTNSGPLAPLQLQSLSLEPGRTAALGLPDVAPTATVGALVESSDGLVVAVLEGKAVRGEGFGAYAVTGVPFLAPARVAVEPDPRAGVPAP